MKEKINKIINEYEEINQKLSDPEISSDPKKYKDLSIRLAEIEATKRLAEDLGNTEKEIAESQELLKSETDQDLILMAEEEE